jgi:hypothetical protein
MPINYKEIAFESAIEEYILQYGGYQKRLATEYNRKLAMDTGVCSGLLKLRNRNNGRS